MPRNDKLIPKTTNGLMRHLRNDCCVKVSSSDKRKLQLIGYYHGYKGYRFVKTGRSPLPISSFKEIVELYNFDMDLKTALYPWVMRLETSLKSCVLEVIAT